MKKVNFKFIVSIIIIVALIALSTSSFAATGSLTVSFVPDVSKAISDKEVSVTLSFTDFNNVDTSLPMAAQANLQYDSSVFSGATIEGLNGWSATLNSENKILIESSLSSNPTEGAVAIVKLTIKDNVTTFNTNITINSLDITNTDGMSEEETNIDISNMSLTARATVSSTGEGSDEEEPDIETPSEDSSTDEPANDPTEDQDNNNDANKDENNNEQETPNKPRNTNETTTDGVKEPEANSIGQVGDLTVAKDPIPQTGVSYIVLGVIALVVVVGTIAFLRYKNMYN